MNYENALWEVFFILNSNINLISPHIIDKNLTVFGGSLYNILLNEPLNDIDIYFYIEYEDSESKREQIKNQIINNIYKILKDKCYDIFKFLNKYLKPHKTNNEYQLENFFLICEDKNHYYKISISFINDNGKHNIFDILIFYIEKRSEIHKTQTYYRKNMQLEGDPITLSLLEQVFIRVTAYNLNFKEEYKRNKQLRVKIRKGISRIRKTSSFIYKKQINPDISYKSLDCNLFMLQGNMSKDYLSKELIKEIRELRLKIKNKSISLKDVLYKYLYFLEEINIGVIRYVNS